MPPMWSETRCAVFRRRLTRAMNIHHLELFYYVATHGGISRAVRHMPYGIQQPAVSSQILQLEEQLGVRLFERMPFALTPPGAELYDAIKPFFDNLDSLAARISKKNVPRLRIGAAEMVLADYLPPVLERLRKRVPQFRLGLQAIGTADLEPLLDNHEIDVALSPLDRRVPSRLKRELLVSLPLALLVPSRSRWKTASDLLAESEPAEPLISLPEVERVCWSFQDELKRRKICWPVSIEASSLALLTRYVENGYGIGLTVHSPDSPLSKKVRALPLEGFPPLELYAVWQGETNVVVAAFLDEVRRYVKEEWPARQVEKGAG